MVKVAITGGTGGLGRYIVEGILATKKHSVVVLSRSPSDAQLEALGAQIVTVDYTNHASLVAALQGVHTVISVIWATDETLATSQIALLRAAVEVGVKRFAPSEFSVRALPEEPLSLYRPKSVVAAAVAKSGLEWTVFENGVFMNYFVSGTQGVGYMVPLKFIIDVEGGTANIPGTGDQKMVFTTGHDVGAFVAASLDLEKWPENCRMVGDIKTYNEVVTIAEKVRGRKFNVAYISEEEVRNLTVPHPDKKVGKFFQEAMIEIIHGRFMYEENLNSLCPEVKPVGVEELLRKWWV